MTIDIWGCLNHPPYSECELLPSGHVFRACLILSAALNGFTLALLLLSTFLALLLWFIVAVVDNVALVSIVFCYANSCCRSTITKWDTNNNLEPFLVTLVYLPLCFFPFPLLNSFVHLPAFLCYSLLISSLHLSFRWLFQIICFFTFCIWSFFEAHTA